MMTPKAVSRKVTPGSVFLDVAYCLTMVVVGVNQYPLKLYTVVIDLITSTNAKYYQNL